MILVTIITVFYTGNLFYFITIDYYKHAVNITTCMCNKKKSKMVVKKTTAEKKEYSGFVVVNFNCKSYLILI